MVKILKFVYIAILFVSLIFDLVNGKSKLILFFFVLFIFYTIFHPFFINIHLLLFYITECASESDCYTMFAVPHFIVMTCIQKKCHITGIYY